MRPFSYHNHTRFCDGCSTVEEMIESAIEHGCDGIGFSAHSFLPRDDGFALPLERTEEYIEAVRAAKVKYSDRIAVYLGLEQDMYTDPADYAKCDFEYKIGSVHGFQIGGVDYSIELTREGFMRAVELFGGDVYAMCEGYFELVSKVCDVTNAEIAGHIDLITKLNEDGSLFDESHPRYLAAAKKAINKLARDGKIFEINTGAMSRGYRSAPYPSKTLLKMIKEAGGMITYSSDCHRADWITCAFDEAVALAKDCGFEGFMKFDGEKFFLERF